MQRGESIHARHHDVQDDHIRWIGRGCLQSILSIDRCVHFEAIKLEVDLDDRQDVRVIVCYEDAFTHFLVAALLIISTAFGGSSALKTADPVTRTEAPALVAAPAFSGVIPPST